MSLKDNFSDSVSNIELLERAKREFNRERKLVIKNLPGQITEEEIKAFLEDFPVGDVTINKQPHQAIVTMEESGSVEAAVNKLKDATLLYTPVTLSVGFSESMLCVAHLPLTLTEWMFRDLVVEHGTVDKCFLMRSEETGESKGYGFVEYSESIEKVGQIKTKLDWSVVEGNAVHCDAVIDRTAHGLMFEDLHSRCLLINNLPLDYKDPIELRELFSKFHKPVYCQVVLKEGESLGFGIIEYAEAEQAETAFKAFFEHKINDTVINLSYCIPGMSAVHMFNRVMFKYGDRVKVNKASLHSDPVYPNPAFLKHGFYKLMVANYPRLLVRFTDNLLHLQQGYVHQLETHTNAKPGILGPAPNIPMSPLMDIHLQLGLLSLVILDLKQKNEYEEEIPEPLGKVRIPTEEDASKKSELPSLLGDPMTAQAEIILKNIIMPPNEVPEFPPRENKDEPCLLGRPIRKLSLLYIQSLGRLMAVMSEKTLSKGLLGNAPTGPRPLMESLLQGGRTGSLQSPSKDNQGLLGQCPAPSNSLESAANFMNTVKNMALNKLNESSGAAKNQILNALFGNQGNSQQQGGGANSGGGPQSLLGKPPPLMGFNGGQNRNQGDGLLPVPNRGQGPGMRNDGSNYDDYDENYGDFDDFDYQQENNRNYDSDSYNDGYDRGYGGNARFGMNRGGYGGPRDGGGFGDSGFYGNDNYRDGGYGRPGMGFGGSGGGSGGGGGLRGEFQGRRMGDKSFKSTPSRKNKDSGLYGGINSDGYVSPRDRENSKEKDYDSIAQQAALYAASTSAAYNQYENYRNYMSGYNSGYNNNSSGYNNTDTGYTGDYESGYTGSGYSGQGQSQGWNSGSSYGGSYNSGSSGSYGSGAGYNSPNSGYGGVRGGGAGGNYGSNQQVQGRSGQGAASGSGSSYSGLGSSFSGTAYGQGNYQGNTGMMKPPLPPGPVPEQRQMGTPQGQKRNSNHFVPSPEPSPEGDYIGQHSQGLGGHYADTYAKRQRLNNRFGAF